MRECAPGIGADSRMGDLLVMLFSCQFSLRTVTVTLTGAASVSGGLSGWFSSDSTQTLVLLCLIVRCVVNGLCKLCFGGDRLNSDYGESPSRTKESERCATRRSRSEGDEVWLRVPQ